MSTDNSSQSTRNKRPKRAVAHEESEGDVWLISYADMVTVLMIFFTMLYLIKGDNETTTSVSESFSKVFSKFAITSGDGESTKGKGKGKEIGAANEKPKDPSKTEKTKYGDLGDNDIKVRSDIGPVETATGVLLLDKGADWNSLSGSILDFLKNKLPDSQKMLVANNRLTLDFPSRQFSDCSFLVEPHFIQEIDRTYELLAKFAGLININLVYWVVEKNSDLCEGKVAKSSIQLGWERLSALTTYFRKKGIPENHLSSQIKHFGFKNVFHEVTRFDPKELNEKTQFPFQIEVIPLEEKNQKMIPKK